MFQPRRLRARKPACVQTMQRNPSSFGSNIQPRPAGIGPARASIGAGRDQLFGGDLQLLTVTPDPGVLGEHSAQGFGGTLGPVLLCRCEAGVDEDDDHDRDPELRHSREPSQESTDPEQNREQVNQVAKQLLQVGGLIRLGDRGSARTPPGAALPRHSSDRRPAAEPAARVGSMRHIEMNVPPRARRRHPCEPSSRCGMPVAAAALAADARPSLSRQCGEIAYRDPCLP